MDQAQKQKQWNRIFEKGKDLFKNGNLGQSKQLFKEILGSCNVQLLPDMYYECLINLSTIQLEQNEIEQARKRLITAFTFNQYRYEAFYNFAVANFYSLKNYSQTVLSLFYCLSLLYLQLGNLTNSLKLINKSISLNPINPKAYLNRAFIYQKNHKTKLAENQYEKLTFQNDFHFNSSTMMEIYLQKCLFYRRINKPDKMQKSLIIYNKLKRQTLSKTENKLNPKIEQIISLQKKSSQWQNKSQQTIKELMYEVHDLITKISHQMQKKQQQQISDKNQIQNLLQHQNQFNKQNLQTNPFNKASNLQKEIKLLQPDLIQLQTLKKKSLISQSNQNQQNPTISVNQQHPSISIYEDEDSAILNKKIQILQKQIKASGGNVPQIKDISRNSQQENFLEFQIQKTIQEINYQKIQQKIIKKNLHSSTQRNTLPEDTQSVISNSQSQRRKSSFHDDTKTLRSKISQSYQINIEEMRTYDSFQLEVRSVSMFDESCPKREAFLKIKYLGRQLLTEKCKNQKLTWNHNFEEQKIIHFSQGQEDESHYQFSVELYAEQGTWLSWHRQILLGKGTIRLSEKGGTKCTLEVNEQKVGMLYYKIKLKKNQSQQNKSNL